MHAAASFILHDRHVGTSGHQPAELPSQQPAPTHLESRAARSAPARSSVSSAAVLPRTAVQCRALCPVPSEAFTSQPRSKR